MIREEAEAFGSIIRKAEGRMKGKGHGGQEYELSTRRIRLLRRGAAGLNRIITGGMYANSLLQLIQAIVASVDSVTTSSSLVTNLIDMSHLTPLTVKVIGSGSLF